jgi:hypothetical protein
MARPRKKNVDYFPHYCQHGKTLTILEARWGNDGYAFWFKLLEMLGAADGHFLDMRDPTTMAFLCAKTRVDEVSAVEILEMLARLCAIDPDLWAVGCLYSQNFVDHVADAYRLRKEFLPKKEALLESFHGRNPAKDGNPAETKGKGKGKGKGKEEIKDDAAADQQAEVVDPEGEAHKPEDETLPPLQVLAAGDRLPPGKIHALFHKAFNREPNGYERPELVELVDKFPRDKLEYAFAEAGQNAASSLRYVRKILEAPDDDRTGRRATAERKTSGKAPVGRFSAESAGPKDWAGDMPAIGV